MKKMILLVLALVMCCSLLAGCQETAVTGAPTDDRTVTLDQTELTAVVGERSVKLSATLSSGRGAFQWTSSNPEVVSVDQNGNVTALAVGSAEITVVCGTLEPATCKVNAILPGYVPVFAADPTGRGIAQSIALGGTLQLDNRVSFNGEPIEPALTYFSQDPAIATVSDTGIITGMKAGTTQIQVVANYLELEVHMTVTVTVL